MRSGFYRYASLIKNDTSYGRRMARLSNRIFGEVTRPTSEKSMKVVKLLREQPHDKNFFFTHWYPRHVETHQLTMKLREYGLYRDEHEDFREEMNRLKDLRGKNWKKNWQIKKGILKE